MFIHFNSNKGVVCDNCGTTSTIMHMSLGDAPAHVEI